jgi:hypothetical protein
MKVVNKLFKYTIWIILFQGRLIAADNWQSLPQPIGNLVRLWSSTVSPPIPPPFPTGTALPVPPFSNPTTGVDEVNYICAQWDPSVTPFTLPFETSVSD